MTPQDRARYSAVDGFTLVELIVVISIMSIVAVAVYPVITMPDEFGLEGAAKVVESDIRYSQISAMSGAGARSVVFTGGSNQYIYDQSADGASSRVRDLTELGAGIVVEGSLSINFNSLGEPDNTAPAEVVLRASGLPRSLTIEPVTGATR